VRILALLQERTASPRERADWLDATLGTVSYHVRTLHDVGLMELVKTTQVRGAIAHHSRRRRRARGYSASSSRSRRRRSPDPHQRAATRRGFAEPPPGRSRARVRRYRAGPTTRPSPRVSWYHDRIGTSPGAASVGVPYRRQVVTRSEASCHVRCGPRAKRPDRTGTGPCGRKRGRLTRSQIGQPRLRSACWNARFSSPARAPILRRRTWRRRSSSARRRHVASGALELVNEVVLEVP
jgi:hypothetical protein